MALGSTLTNRLNDGLASCVDYCVLHARAVLVATFLVTAASLGVTALFLSVNTDTDGMIDSNLDFRKRFDDFTRAFPQLDKTLVAVVDADTPEIATEAARSLVTSFETRPDLFSDIYAPGVSHFFDSHGLLYLPEAELNHIAGQMQAGLPLIGALTRDQSLRGLAQLFQGLAYQAQQGATLAGFSPFLEELDRVVQEHTAGRNVDLEWDKFLSAGSADRRGTRRFVFVKPVLDFTSLAPAEAAMSEARRLASDPETIFSGAARVRFTGDIALSAEEMRSVTDSAVLAGLISLVLVSLVLTIGVRSWRLVTASLISLIVGLIWTAGVATLTVGYLNLISVAFAVLFVGLGIDFAIHFCLRYEEESRRGRPLRIALANTATGVGGALGVATAAAALGFLAFTPTAFAGMAQLGIISAAGMIVAFITTLTVLPALLTLMPLEPEFPEETGLRQPDRPFWRQFRAAATVVTLIVCAAGAFFVDQVRFDGDPVNLKDPETPSVQMYMELFSDGTTSPYIIQVLVRDQAEVARLSAQLSQLPEVRGVLSVLNFLPPNQERKLPIIQTLRLAMQRIEFRPSTDIGEQARLQSLATIQGALAALSGLPDQTVAAAALHLHQSFQTYSQTAIIDPATTGRLELAIFRKLPAVVDRIRVAVSAREVTAQTLPGDIRDRYISASDGRYRLEVLPSGNVSSEAELRRFVDAVLAAEPSATGSPIEIVGAADVVVDAMLYATAIAGGLILVVLLITLRSIVSMLLVVLPIALAGTLTLAATVWFEIPFNFANVIVLPLLIGLGVAGGVHLVVRARTQRDGQPLMNTNTPRAVLLSALTTIGSFASLAVSTHQGMASMGSLLTIAIAFTLICTLIVLPTLLDVIERLRSPQR